MSWRERVRRLAAALVFGAVIALSTGCANHVSLATGNPVSTGPAPSPGSSAKTGAVVGAVVPTSWVSVPDAINVSLIQWTQVADRLTGAWQSAAVPARGDASPTINRGTVVGLLLPQGKLEVTMMGTRWSGRVDNSDLVLAADGADSMSMATFAFQPGSTASYNRAVMSLSDRQEPAAQDRVLTDELNQVAVLMQAYYVEHRVYPGTFRLGRLVITSAWPAAITIGATKIALSSNDAMVVMVNKAGTAYCITAVDTSTSRSRVYVSSLGGLQPAAEQSCPRTY